MNVQTVQQFLRAKWQCIAVFGGLFAALAVLQFALLGSLLSGFSGHEVESFWASASVHNIWHQPLNAPFALLAHLFIHFLPQSLFAVRLASAMFGFATLIIFFALVRVWYGERTAMLATAMFGSSSWYLHTARLGTASVLSFGLFALTAALVWARRSQRPLAWFSCLALAAGLLYVPGMIWFMIAGGLWQARSFGGLAWQRRWVSLAGAAFAVVLLAPLAWAMYQTPHLLKTWAGIPAVWPGMLHVLHHISLVPVHLVVWGPGLPEYWLSHVPMLDLFATVMLAFGVAPLLKTSRRLLAGFALALVLGCVLIGLGGVSLALLAPFVYLLIAGGLHDFLGRWLRVFPRNPLARRVGVGLIALAVVMACAYNIRAYFIAWPQSSTTESAFTHQHP